MDSDSRSGWFASGAWLGEKIREEGERGNEGREDLGKYKPPDHMDEPERQPPQSSTADVRGGGDVLVDGLFRRWVRIQSGLPSLANGLVVTKR